MCLCEVVNVGFEHGRFLTEHFMPSCIGSRVFNVLPWSNWACVLQVLVPEEGGRLVVASDGVWDAFPKTSQWLRHLRHGTPEVGAGYALSEPQNLLTQALIPASLLLPKAPSLHQGSPKPYARERVLATDAFLYERWRCSMCPEKGLFETVALSRQSAEYWCLHRTAPADPLWLKLTS